MKSKRPIRKTAMQCKKILSKGENVKKLLTLSKRDNVEDENLHQMLHNILHIFNFVIIL